MRETTCFEEGDPESPLCFLAEAPGAHEVRANQPLIGPSGEIFNESLHIAGLIRAASYIVNIIPFKVYKDERENNAIYDPRNRERIWHPKSGFSSYGLQIIEPQLELLRKCKANLIVPMGQPALDALYPKRASITKLRGSILWSDVIKRKIIPTFHPTYILRGQSIAQYMLTSDLERANNEQRYPDMRLPKRHLQITPTFSQALAYLRGAKKSRKPIAVDIEATHTIFCIGFSNDPAHAISIPWIDEHRQSYYSESQEIDLWLAIQDIVGDPKIPKLGQLFLFDIDYLFIKPGLRFRGPLWDTGVLHSLLYPDFKKGLDFLVSMHTREPYYKDEGKIWKHPYKDLTSFWLYNAKDACCTLEVWNAIKPIADEGGYWPIYEQTMNLVDPLTYMMRRGLKIDTKALKESLAEADTQLIEKRNKLASIAKEPFNPSSPIQVGRYFYDVLNIKPYLHHKTKKRTTDDKAMARIYRRHRLPEAKLIQEIRKLEKSKSTYLEVNYDKDGRLRCFYNLRGNKFGRLSSSETVFETGTNMQNLPQLMKRFLVSDREP